MDMHVFENSIDAANGGQEGALCFRLRVILPKDLGFDDSEENSSHEDNCIVETHCGVRLGV